MDQTAILTVSIPLFVGSIALTWFLLTRAPGLPRELSERADESSVRLRLIGSVLLRDLRNDLNVALKEHDEGNDQYLTRVDYQVPSITLRRYRKIMQLERAARNAPRQVQKRLRFAVLIAIILTALFFATSVLAGLESLIGRSPSHYALIASGVTVTAGLILSGFFFVRPYLNVSKSEIRGLQELKAQPGLRIMAEALGVAPDKGLKAEEW